MRRGQNKYTCKNPYKNPYKKHCNKGGNVPKYSTYKKHHKSKTRSKPKSKTRSKAKSKFVKLNCSPENKDVHLNSYTCYSNEDLHKLRDIWNARHPDNIIDSEDPKVIWSTIKYHYITSCNKESYWINKLAKGTKLEKSYLIHLLPSLQQIGKKSE